MGYYLCKVADFQKRAIFGIFGVCFERFFAQNNSNFLVESFFACVWHFKILTQTDHFAKALALTWAPGFARWSNILEYLVFFRAVFSHRTTLGFFKICFLHVFGILNF